LTVEKFRGVGPATAAKMNRLGIKTGFDLKEQTLAFLQQHFGKPGPYYYWIARGIDERPVRADRIRKSLGAENTFSADIFTFVALDGFALLGDARPVPTSPESPTPDRALRAARAQ
jgi:DNA polymerase-4